MSPRGLTGAAALNGSRRVPERYQFQTTECGVATLASILAYFGRELSMDRVRELTSVSRDCVTAADLLKAGRELGFECKARRCEPEGLAALGLPLIVHLNFIHFVVVEEITEDVVRVMDPASGPHEILRESFDDSFTGIALTFRPPADPAAAASSPGSAVAGQLDDKDPAPAQPGLRRRLAHFLRHSGSATALAMTATRVVASILAATAVLLLTSGAGGQGPAAASLLLLAMLLEFGAHLGLARLEGMTARHWRERLLRGVMAQGPGFFAYRIPTSLRDAILQPEHSARRLCGDVMSAGGSLATLPVWVLAAVLIHPLVGGLLAAAVAVCLGVAVCWAQHPVRRYDSTGNPSRVEETLAGQLMFVESWRTGVRPREFSLSAIDADASAQAGRQRLFGQFTPLRAYRALLLPALTSTLALGALLTSFDVAQGFALGLLALAMGRALEPLVTLPDALSALEKDLIKLEDFEDSTSKPVSALTAEALNDGMRANPNAADGAVLTARDLSFSHAPRQPLVFEDLELEVFRGEQLGITGPSGGGKSTLARLLAGIEVPRSGEVSVASELLPVGWLEKSPILFRGSIRENLCLGRQDLHNESLWLALADACLDEVIAARPGGLDAVITPGGRSLSGGQEQRLELAQALLQGARLLVIDEALDGLNPSLEATLRERLRRRGCTLIIVSHRAATLAHCDRVLRLKDGLLLEVSPQSFAASPGDPQQEAEAFAQEASGSSLNMPGSEAMAAAMVESEVDEYELMRRASGLGDTLRLLTRGEASAAGGHGADAFPDALWDAGFTLRGLLMRHGKWWQFENGPLLALSGSSGQGPTETSAQAEVCAVLPDPRGPQLLDASGQHQRLSPALSNALSPRALRLYPPADLEAAGFGATLLRALRGSGADALALGLSSLLLAMIVAAGPLALADLLGSVLGSGFGNGGEPAPADRLPRGLALLLLMAGAVLVAQAAWRFRVRIEDRTRHAFLVAFAGRLARIDVAFVLESAREDIVASAKALSASLREWPDHLFDALLHGTILVVLLLLLGFSAPPATAWIAGFASVGLLAVFLGLACWRSACVEHRVASGIRQRTSLLRQLAAQARLRALRAHERLLEQWLDADRAVMASAGPIDGTRAVQGALASVGPWLAVLLGFMVVEQTIADMPVMALLGLMLLWLSVDRAAKLAEALTAAMDLNPEVRRLEVLTRAPVEPRLPISGGPSSRAACLPIEAQNVVVRRGSETVLHGLSWSISAGETVGIAGVSGSGKSTLIEVLLGFRAPDQGVVKVAGTDLQVMDRPRWRQRLGAVLQGERLDRSITLRGHLIGSVPAANDRLWSALRDVELAAQVEAMPMGIQTIVDDIRLSTGQRQRLLLARALLREPDMLLLDEALNAIPIAMQARIMARLRERGIACVVITHDATLLRQLDRVDVLEAGRIVCSGPPTEVMTDPRLRAILDVERLTT